MNWNIGKRDASLKWFVGRGHPQLIAGYYDQPPGRVTEWLKAARQIEDAVGAMYTTWQRNHNHLERFAEIISGMK